MLLHAAPLFFIPNVAGGNVKPNKDSNFGRSLLTLELVWCLYGMSQGIKCIQFDCFVLFCEGSSHVSPTTRGLKNSPNLKLKGLNADTPCIFGSCYSRTCIKRHRIKRSPSSKPSVSKALKINSLYHSNFDLY